MNSRKSGCARLGRDLNSGWNCTPTNHGCSGTSTISTSRSFGAQAGQLQTGVGERLTEDVVELIAVAVALVNHRLTIGGHGAGLRLQTAGIRAQPHGTALLGDVLLLGHQVDHRVLGGLGEFGAVSVGHTGHVTGVLDDRQLHAQADAKIGDVVLPGIAGRANHALDAPVAEAAGHDDAVAAGQPCGDVLIGELFGVDPVDVHVDAALVAAVEEALRHGEIGVVQGDVFANQRNAHRALGGENALDHLGPLSQVGLGQIQPQTAAHGVVEPLFVEHQGHAVERGRGEVLNDAGLVDVAEQGNLVDDILRRAEVGAADNDVRLDADGSQLLDRVLGGLALEFVRARNADNQGDVDEHAVFAANLVGILTQGLEEGLRLDVAHRAAHLGDDHVRALTADAADALHNLPGDVGDDLHRAAQIVAAALAGNDAVIDFTRMLRWRKRSERRR